MDYEISSEVRVNSEPTFSAELGLKWKHWLGCISVYILWIEITCFVKPVPVSGCWTGRDWVRGGKRGEETERKEEWVKLRRWRQNIVSGKPACFLMNPNWLRLLGSESAYIHIPFWFGTPEKSPEAKPQQDLVLACAWLHVWGYFIPICSKKKKKALWTKSSKEVAWIFSNNVPFLLGLNTQLRLLGWEAWEPWNDVC